MTTPVLGLTELSNTSGERSTIIDTVRVLDAINGNVPTANININTPPVTPSDGEIALISSAPTGVFAGFPGHLAIYIGTGWQLIPPQRLGAISTESGFYKSNATFDGWVVLSGGGGTSPLTTKGDLFTFGTSDARLPVGANGQVLTADSAETLGLKWSSTGVGTTVQLNGSTIASGVGTINFTGSNILVTSPSAGVVNISVTSSTAGGGGASQLASAFYLVDGDNNTNDGTLVSALTSLGTTNYTTSQSNTSNQPQLVVNAFGTKDAWDAVDTGNDSTRESFNISPAIVLPSTGWTVMIAGTIRGTTQILANTSNLLNITIPSGNRITVDTPSGQAQSSVFTRAFPDTYVWVIAYNGSSYQFYQGLTALDTAVGNGALTFNSIGQIQSNIRRTDCRLGIIACWDTLLSNTDRDATVTAVAASLGITL